MPPAPAAPAIGLQVPPAQNFNFVDPTPDSEPAAAPPAPASPAPAREVQLDRPSDPNRVQIPDSIYEGLEAKVKGKTTAAPAEPKEPAKEPTEQLEKPAAEKPAEPPVDDDPELEKQVQSFKTLKEVRTAHKEALKRERAWQREQETVKKQLQEYEAKLKEWNPEAAKATTAELEAARKRAEDLEARVKLLDYTQSSEFHERHIKPVAKALEAAYADLEEMTVQEGDSVRKATQADFKGLLQMPLQQAISKAKELFGEAASEVLAHRRAVIQLERAKREAVENAGKASEEARQKASVEQSQHLQKLQATYKQRSDEVVAKFPEFFKPRDGDKEGNELLDKGHKLLDALDSQDIAEDDRVKIAAEVRHRAAAFGRLVYDYGRLQKENAEMAAKLKAYEKSAPDRGEGTTNGAAVEPADPWDRANKSLEALAKPMR